MGCHVIILYNGLYKTSQKKRVGCYWNVMGLSIGFSLLVPHLKNLPVHYSWDSQERHQPVLRTERTCLQKLDLCQHRQHEVAHAGRMFVVNCSGIGVSSDLHYIMGCNGFYECFTIQHILGLSVIAIHWGYRLSQCTGYRLSVIVIPTSPKPWKPQCQV